MKPVAEFYRTIHNKTCVCCGKEFVEQHESYLMECERCMNLRDE